MQRRAFFKAVCALIGATLVEPGRALASPVVGGTSADGSSWQLLEGERSILVSWRKIDDQQRIMMGVLMQLEPGIVYKLSIEPPDEGTHVLTGLRSFNQHGEIEITSYEDASGISPDHHHAPDMGFYNTDDVFVPIMATIRKGEPVTMTLRTFDGLSSMLNLIVVVDTHVPFEMPCMQGMIEGRMT